MNNLNMMSPYQVVNEAFAEDTAQILSEGNIKPENVATTKDLLKQAGFKHGKDFSDDGKKVYIADMSIAQDVEDATDRFVVTADATNPKNTNHKFEITIMKL